MAEGKVETPKEKPRHRAVMMKQHFRTIYLKVNQMYGATRSEERWLNAASNETEDHAELIEEPGAMFKGKEYKDPKELVQVDFTDDATKGIRLALVNAIKGDSVRNVPPATIALKRDYLSIAASFGKKFKSMIEKETLPPEGKDLDEDDPLEIDDEVDLKLITDEIEEVREAKAAREAETAEAKK